MSLKGKVAVITGGEGPLGMAVSQKFLSEGAKILIGLNSPEEWEEAKGLIFKIHDGEDNPAKKLIVQISPHALKISAGWKTLDL